MSNPPRRPVVAPLLAGLIALITGACLYDPDHRCGPAMMFVEAANACVCNSNAIPVPGGCQPCAPDEVAVAGKCGCAAGQTKSANNVCVAVAGLGDACNTTSAPCTDTTYSYCAVRGSGTSGTCTRTCSNNADCDSTYTCATWDAHPYCRTFDGAGKSCSTSNDCSGDATYCDAYMTHTCVVSGCSVSDNNCPRGTACCDLSRFGIGTLCTGSCS
jgi:hypothetical protein